MAKMFKFVPSDGDGVSQKRQQTAQACENCRRRKKRCFHSRPAPLHYSTTIRSGNHIKSNSNYTSPGSSTLVPASPPRRSRVTSLHVASTPNAHQSPPDSTLLPALSRSQQRPIPLSDSDAHSPSSASPARIREQPGRTSRFIGDSNPEGIFLTATSPEVTRDGSGDSVGVWLTSNLGRNGDNPAQSAVTGSSSLFFGSGPLVQKVLVPMLEQECRSMLPSPAQVEALSKIYFEKVHSILPVIDITVYNSLEHTDPCRIILTQGICLAASKDFDARPHLTLTDSSKLLACRDFGDRISSSMRLAIDIGLISSKIVVIQALALMSQFTDNPVGEDLSAQ